MINDKQVVLYNLTIDVKQTLGDFVRSLDHLLVEKQMVHGRFSEDTIMISEENN